MKRLSAAALCLVLIIAATVGAVDKSNPVIKPLGSSTIHTLRTGARLSAADTCTGLNADSLAWLIQSWIIGDELYKAYIDPELTCPAPYPFTILEVHMFLNFDAPTPIIYGADIEAADWTNSSCPAPGELLYYSDNFSDEVPEANLYDIWVELDTPVVVNEPFFAGFYIGGGLADTCNPCLVTDVTPVTCNSYNIWDENVGFIDLVNNSYYNFPGRIWLFVVGITGGHGGAQPEPVVVMMSPAASANLLGSADLWAWEQSGSDIIDYVSFEYSTGGAYTEIGRDYEGLRPLRDGSHAILAGNGYSYDWDFSSLAEGSYYIRTTAVDTLGRSSADSVAVYLEPTPPKPTIVSPDFGDTICTPVNILMQCNDADMLYVEMSRKMASSGYSLGLDQVNAAGLGYYRTGPVAVAIAVKAWFDRGFSYLMKSGSNYETTFELAGKIANAIPINDSTDSYDELLLTGVRKFFIPRGNLLEYDYMRNPDYLEMRSWVEELERVVVIGLSGDIGVYMTVDGFPGWEQPDGSYNITVSDPLTGTIVTLPMRQYAGVNQVQYEGSWLNIDIMISFYVKDWTSTRQTIGGDFNSADGWSFNWTPTGLYEDSLYFIRSKGTDGSGFSDISTIMTRYNCSAVYLAGDYNNDGSTDVTDLVYLIDNIVHAGPAPVGGASRADANGDGLISVSDIIYYLNFIFTGMSQPAH
ncbi:MAG TPA: dockerin type I repeat-containing protein [candidate division Zixibacteria bacterium]|nr:dockerin type I repeat-containing protein [candidate division Zixibacteria bacterium]